MSRILVTGSAQGVGAEASRQLIEAGHEVVVHGRSDERCREALRANPDALGAVPGAFDSIASTTAFAQASEAYAPFDVIIHNAAVGPHQDRPVFTQDGLERIFHVNVVSPYLLSCLLPVPQRAVYVGSDAGQHGSAHFDDLQWDTREWNGMGAYNDSKLYLAMIAMEMAHRHPGSLVNVVHPGWVQTSMGGANALLPVDQGADSVVWLATSADAVATTSGQFIEKRAALKLNPQARDSALRARLLDELERITGVALP